MRGRGTGCRELYHRGNLVDRPEEQWQITCSPCPTSLGKSTFVSEKLMAQALLPQIFGEGSDTVNIQDLWWSAASLEGSNAPFSRHLLAPPAFQRAHTPDLTIILGQQEQAIVVVPWVQKIPLLENTLLQIPHQWRAVRSEHTAYHFEHM